jgi:transcriptional regulator with XRE-family HTH domain
MKSKTVTNLLPARLRQGLRKLGADLAAARKKRHFTVAMVAQRVGIAKATYQRVEQGDPSVGMGTYAMTLFVLGFPDGIAQLADARTDDTGLLLDAERLPQRVRIKKSSSAL